MDVAGQIRASKTLVKQTHILIEQKQDTKMLLMHTFIDTFNRLLTQTLQGFRNELLLARCL